MKYFLLAIIIFFTGCSSNSELSDLSAGPTEKQMMFNEKIEKFNKAVYWGNTIEIANYIEPTYLQKFLKTANAHRESEDLVETKVKSINYFDDSSKATAFIEIRSFNKKTLIVNSRFEKLDWEFFRLHGGWLLKNSDEISEEHFAHLVSE